MSESPGVHSRDLCFLVHTYQDREELHTCIRRLRTVYDQAPLIIVCDGDVGDSCRELQSRGFYTRHFRFSDREAAHAAESTIVHEGERLFVAERGGEIVHRMLGLFLELSSASYLMKIDTDTHVRRVFRRLPGQECCFGTLQNAPRAGTSVQGGCMGFTRGLAERLHASRVFLDDDLKVTRIEGSARNSDTWVRTEYLRKRVEQHGLASIDWIVAHVARKKFPIEFVEFEEVRCLYARRPRDEHRYAVTHPSAERAKSMRYPLE